VCADPDDFHAALRKCERGNRVQTATIAHNPANVESRGSEGMQISESTERRFVIEKILHTTLSFLHGVSSPGATEKPAASLGKRRVRSWAHHDIVGGNVPCGTTECAQLLRRGTIFEDEVFGLPEPDVGQFEQGKECENSNLRMQAPHSQLCFERLF
jgi:hypothetical protein